MSKNVELANRELYRFLLKESRCSSQKRFCKRNCNSCPLFTSEETSFKYFAELQNRIKARDPELYFVNEVEELKGILGNNLTNEKPEE